MNATIQLKESLYTGRNKATEVYNILLPLISNRGIVELICSDNTLVTSSFLLHLHKLCGVYVYVTGGSSKNASEYTRYLLRRLREAKND